MSGKIIIPVLFFIIFFQFSCSHSETYEYPDILNFPLISVCRLREIVLASDHKKIAEFDKVNITGMVVSSYRCPPCPEGYKCEPCLSDDYIVLANSKCTVKIETVTVPFIVHKSYTLSLQKKRYLFSGDFPYNIAGLRRMDNQ